MSKNGEKKYLYCVINTAEPANFNVAGVNGDCERIHSVNVNDIAAIVGDSETDIYRFTRSTAMAHESVIRSVMQNFTVLPFSFGIVANNEKEVTDLLTHYYEEFRTQLQYLEDKTEFDLKALWKDKEQPFQEILAERQDIARYRSSVACRPPAVTYQDRLEIGRMVQEALEAKKKEEGCRILERLRPLAASVQVNATFMDEMLLSAAFLLIKGAEQQFEKALQELDHIYEDKVRFRMVGPTPAFNFVRMPISLK